MSRNVPRAWVALGLAAGVGSAAHPAQAQNGEYLEADILLLLDTSGSMARTTVRDPANPSQYGLPVCGNPESFPDPRPVDPAATAFGGTLGTPPDRWMTLVSILTGTVKGMQCAAQERNSAPFVAEYSLEDGSRHDPYDIGYYLPFNRIVASDGTHRCTPAPSWNADLRAQLRADAITWPVNDTGGPIVWRDLDQPYSSAAPCPFEPQQNDGVIDRRRASFRFGIMTFDPMPHWRKNASVLIGTGLVPGSRQASYEGGIADTWSYFPNWLDQSSPWTDAARGWPGGCETDQNKLFEVGARNPAAPPWEGRLMGFGDPLAGSQSNIVNNDRVQQALLAMRPYHATPIAGMLADAKHFLVDDTTLLKDSQGASVFWGGTHDKAVSTTQGEDACRRRMIILITDGGPNLDLQPHCDPNLALTPAGRCPYPTPQQSAAALWDKNIKVHVVGFSVTTNEPAGSTKTCKDLMTPSLNGGINDPCAQLNGCTVACGADKCAYGYCLEEPNDDVLAACCTLEEIAKSGGGAVEYAENAAQLATAIDNLLSDVPASQTKTQPIFIPGNFAVNNASANAIAGARFFSGYERVPNDLFAGRIRRERYKCTAVNNGPPEAKEQTLVSSLGDMFDNNLDASRTLRTVYTVVAEPDGSGAIHSDRSIRPFYNEGTGDRLGIVSVLSGSSNADSNMVSGLATIFPTLVDSRAIFGSNNCTKCCLSSGSYQSPTAAQCTTRFLRMELGLPTGETSITANDTLLVRSSALGPLINATPEAMTRPNQQLRDETYGAFQQWFANRPPVLFAASADGQLHAFKLDRLDNELNELWTFIPPAALPQLPGQFPSLYSAAPSVLLSGPLVLTEVIGKAEVPPNGQFLKRTRVDAKDPSAATTRWFSILVAPYGSGPGYFALDVTSPDPAADLPVEGYVQGPRFLWQLTTDSLGNPLFGDQSTRPSITTLYFTMPGEQTPAEHAVAILPGGFGGERSTTDSENVTFAANPPALDSRLTPRMLTRRYTPGTSTHADLTLAGARSLTVVRLDTGEVIRTFRRGATGSAPAADDALAPPGLYQAGRITAAPFDAPMVGEIITYPSEPGAVADRAYLGDAEGRLWRVDLTSVDPGEWAVSLFHDAYPTDGLSTAYTWRDGAPIATPPIVSTDPIGRVTVAISTGEQETLSKTGKYPVWSLTEKVVDGKPKAEVNWLLNETNAVGTDTTACTIPIPNTIVTNHFAEGERVTGPMALFDSVLYFTTYAPAAVAANTNACNPAESFIWGVHYLQAVDGVAENGPVAKFDCGNPNVASATPPVINVKPQGAGSLVYGVGVMQKPTCFAPENTVDPFLGYGTHKSIRGMTPGTFQLVIQKSGQGTPGATGVFVETKDLRAPTAGSQIDSWAAILE